MKAIILAAGKGSNLNPFSNTRPIPMISVAGKTLLDNSLCQLKNAGINDVYIVVGHHKERIQDFVDLRTKMAEDYLSVIKDSQFKCNYF